MNKILTHKTLVLVRHGHRDKKLGHSTDNGISKKGEHQAELILQHFKSTYKDQKPEIISSPKKRCVETVAPLSKHMNCQIKTLPILNEGGDCFEKAQKFIQWWSEEASDLVIACSHGDLIPVLIQTLSGTELNLSKGGWAEFHLTQGKTTLNSLIQDLDFN